MAFYTQTADLRDSLYLVKHGVPFDVAFSLDGAERLAWVVTLGELEGRRWSHGAGEWQA